MPADAMHAYAAPHNMHKMRSKKRRRHRRCPKSGSRGSNRLFETRKVTLDVKREFLKFAFIMEGKAKCLHGK
jgi:hypothetical protein